MKTHPSAEERVDQERHAVVRQSMGLLTRRPEHITQQDTRRFVVAIMHDSVLKQARWLPEVVRTEPFSWSMKLA